MSGRIVPLESYEAMQFASRLKTMKLENSGHIPNETYTPYYKVRMRNTRMGVTKGIPDFIVCIPKNRTRENKALLLFIEMKRQYAPPSSVKSEQKRWISALGEVDGVHATIAKGASEAIQYVLSYMAGRK